MLNLPVIVIPPPFVETEPLFTTWNYQGSQILGAVPTAGYASSAGMADTTNNDFASFFSAGAGDLTVILNNQVDWSGVSFSGGGNNLVDVINSAGNGIYHASDADSASATYAQIESFFQSDNIGDWVDNRLSYHLDNYNISAANIDLQGPSAYGSVNNFVETLLTGGWTIANASHASDADSADSASQEADYFFGLVGWGSPNFDGSQIQNISGNNVSAENGPFYTVADIAFAVATFWDGSNLSTAYTNFASASIGEGFCAPSYDAGSLNDLLDGLNSRLLALE